MSAVGGDADIANDKARDQFSAVCDLLGRSAGIGEIAKATGLSRQAIYRIKDDPAVAEAALACWAT
jgi:putative DNA-invertase from lambdoid prophage Rac